MPGAATGNLHPDGRDLLVAHPNARIARFAVGRDTKHCEHVDEYALERADVRHDVTKAVTPVGKRDDRVADELSRPVVGDVSAAIRVRDVSTHVRRRHQDVLWISCRAQREHVRVFEQQQVVVIGAPVERALNLVCFPVRDATEPPCSEHQSSSASQSRVSSSLCIAPRNAAA